MRRLTAVAAIATLVCELGNLCGAPEKRIDLAAIVSKKDAESTLGEAVKDPQPRNEEGADGYYSRCNYYSQNPGRSLVLRVRQASAGQLAPAKQLEELMAGSGEDQTGVRFGRQSRARERRRAKQSFPSPDALCREGQRVCHGRDWRHQRRKSGARESEGAGAQDSRETLGDDTEPPHFDMVANVNGPHFSGGANIAIKCPSHTYEQTLAFYRDTLGLPLIEEEDDGCIFQFGPNRLWIDRVPNLSHPDIWLELETNDTEAAASYLKINGIPRRDEVEQLREDFDGFWISDPAGVIHLVVGDEE